MKKYILTIFLLMYSSVFSQTHLSVKGQVISSTDKDALIGATVILTRSSDESTQGMVTDLKGRFIFSEVKPGKYLLNITYVGFRKYEQSIELRNRSLDLQKILLEPEGVKTQEVQIIGKLPPVTQKSDTAEFNADAFKTNKNADAEDLVAKMPGIMVQDGKIQAHGEDVKRVLVDGKPFFGDDPNAVLKNIPAEVVEKIQVFDQQSEQAQFTGFDDGNSAKTINIVTRLRITEGTFGKLTGAYGNEQKYKTGGNINLFNNDQKISILGQINNVNEQNFSSEDLLGVMNSGRGGRGGGGGMRGGGRGPGGGGMGDGGPGNWGGGGASNFLVNTKNGLAKTQALGVNYTDKWGESIDISGSYFVNSTNNNAESYTKRQYYPVSNVLDQQYSEDNISNSDNINHRFNLRLDYQIDQSNSLMFRPNLSFQKNDGNSSVWGKTLSGEKMLNSIVNSYNSNLSALNSASELLYRHRFETPGRTLSIGMNGTYKDNEGDSKLFSENLYFENRLFSDTLDQVADMQKKGWTGTSNIVYTEPINESSQLQFSTRVSYSEDNSDQKTYNDLYGSGSYSMMDTSLSNLYKKIYRTQSFGTGYRYQKEKLNFMFNLSYNISQMQSDQSFPYAARVEKNFQAFLPSFMLRYGASRDQNLRIFYRTSNNDPSVEQLQNVLNNSNPVQLSIGNPKLKQDYSHQFSMRYSQINFESMQSYFLMLGGTFTQNYIGNSTTIAYRDTTTPDGILLKQGTQLVRPENLDGYLSLRSFFTYGMPVDFLKSNLNLSLNANYSHTPGMINNVTNYSNSMNYGLGVVLSSNIGEYLDFNISSNSSYNTIRNSSKKDYDNNYFNQNSRIKFFWEFWWGIFIQNEVSHQYNGGLSKEYNPNSVSWNLSLGKKLFSNEQGEIRVTAYDMLNQNTNIQRNVTDSYYEDSRSNVLGRYFIVSFTYNIKSF